MQLGAGGSAFTAMLHGSVAMILALKIIEHVPIVDDEYKCS